MNFHAVRLAFALLAFSPLLSAAASALDVIDDTGRSIHLAAAAQRIVSLGPHATELLFDVGAGRQVVGAIEYSDYPAAASAIPRVGGYRGLDLEKIAALKPDLIIAWDSGNSHAQVEALERLGIAVFRSDPKSLEDVATSLQRFGMISGHAAEGERAAQAFRDRAASLRATYAQRAPVRVFYQVWNQPLMTLGGSHLVSAVIRLCGGRNIFQQLAALSPTVDVEAVVAADPQVIVAASSDGGDLKDMAMWKQWPAMAAVRDGRYVLLDPGIITRHTPRILDGAEQLCRALDAARKSGR